MSYKSESNELLAKRIFKRRGVSSCTFDAGCRPTRCYGLMWCRRQVTIRLCMMPMCLAPISVQLSNQFFRPVGSPQSFCPHRAGGRNPLSLARVVWSPRQAKRHGAAPRDAYSSCRSQSWRSDNTGCVDARSGRMRQHVNWRATDKCCGIMRSTSATP
jgi:hypothetical protein